MNKDELKLQGWNLPKDKKEFVRFLIKETAANFHQMAVDSGRVTKEDYWNYVSDLKALSKHFFDVDIEWD